ncbi:MAG: VWA domain-containing protein [Isosphaeraceae bacterium]
MRLAEPWWLLLLLLAPLPAVFDRFRPRIAWPTLGGFPKRHGSLTRVRAAAPGVLRGLAVGCLAVALARPQEVAGRTRIAGQGVAIMVALDHSPSMSTPDAGSSQPDAPPVSRLEAARSTLAGLVDRRPEDLIGLVVFARYADLASPPTLEHEYVASVLRSVRPARPGDYGTNIGDALVWSLGAFQGLTTPKKVLILLTDGRNNPARTPPPPADPMAAARLARELNVTVHTIALGQGGRTVERVEPVTNLEITTEAEGPDLQLLQKIAEAGGGRAFVARDAGALEQVIRTVDSLEKSTLRGEVRTRYREAFVPWAAAALGLIAADLWLGAGWLRRLP